MPDDSPPLTPEAENAAWRGTLETVIALQARAREAGGDTTEADEKVRRTIELATDEELLAEWANGAWSPGDGSSEAIADEIDRRQLNIGEVERRGPAL